MYSFITLYSKGNCTPTINEFGLTFFAKNSSPPYVQLRSGNFIQVISFDSRCQQFNAFKTKIFRKIPADCKHCIVQVKTSAPKVEYFNDGSWNGTINLLSENQKVEASEYLAEIFTD